MELFGHFWTLYSACIRHHVEHHKALEFVEEYGAKLCLTDAIRCCVIGEDVVNFGRAYSHFTDGSGMTLPFGKKLKEFSDIHETVFVNGKGYVNKFVDQPTDFGRFIRMNSDMFAKENEEWGIAILSHLNQDVDNDLVWQQEICTCDTKNNIVIYNHTRRQVTPGDFKDDKALVNVYMHRMFVEYVWNVFGQEVTEKEFMARVYKSLDKWYSEKMSTHTKKYLNMDKRVFYANEEEKSCLAKEIIETGMFVSREHLDYVSIKLFQDAMASLNPLINHIICM